MRDRGVRRIGMAGIAASGLAVVALLLGAAAANAAVTPADGPIAGGTATTIDVPALSYAQISAGGSQTTALTSDGAVYAWGDGSGGQLGPSTTANAVAAPVPILFPSGVTVTQVASGTGFSLALTSTGSVYAWGQGASGQLGNGTTGSSSTPQLVSLPAGVTITQLSAGMVSISGQSHALALASDGRVFAWGYGAVGELGDGLTASSSTPVQVVFPAGTPPITQVDASNLYSLAIDADGVVWAWGQNGPYSTLGDGTMTNHATPIKVALPAGVAFAQVSGGLSHAVALAADGTAYAWGTASVGRLGNGSTSGVVRKPVQVLLPPGVALTSVSAGGSHSLGLTADGAAYAWGYGANGRLGNGGTANEATPVAVTMPAGVSFRSVSAGGAASFAVASDGSAYSWGANLNSDLGDGSGADRDTPGLVLPPLVVTGVTFGGAAGTALTAPGPSTVTVTTPAHTAGSVDVVVSTQTQSGAAGPDYTFSHGFTYVTAPVIVSPGLPGGTSGVPYSHGVTASGTGPVSYGVSRGALPPGLTLDPATGTISGTPTGPGSFSFDITVSSPYGSATASYTVTVAAGAGTDPGQPGPPRLAATGLDVVPALALGAGILLAGVLVQGVRRLRRR